MDLKIGSVIRRLRQECGITQEELARDDCIARIHTMLRDERTLSPDRFTWAERYLKGLLADSPANTEARTLLVELYEHRESSDSLAVGRLCEEGLLFAPTDEGLHGKLARLRERRAEPERLIAFLEPMVQAAPANVPAGRSLVKRKSC